MPPNKIHTGFCEIKFMTKCINPAETWLHEKRVEASKKQKKVSPLFDIKSGNVSLLCQNVSANFILSARVAILFIQRKK